MTEFAGKAKDSATGKSQEELVRDLSYAMASVQSRDE